MITPEQTLWDKIRHYKLDDKDASFTFSERLARENGWSKKYTEAVITEYKKFLFLCCIAEKGVTPSDPVDQAWHLHLTYTRSYWTDLCKNTLEKEIHHNPTKGGDKEVARFNTVYTSTQQLYINVFGTVPPAAIWHDNDTRFSDINFQRVNTDKYWLVKKPAGLVAKFAGIFVICVLPLLFIQATSAFLLPVMFMAFFLIAVIIAVMKNSPVSKKKKGCGCDSAGCANGCGSNESGGHHGGDSGCANGCYGCSDGCSGCGGGD